MGPHPAVAEIRLAVRHALGELPDGRPLVVACSGGADSVALAASTAFIADRTGRPAALVTVDHRLQDGSAERAGTVAALGYELGFDPVSRIAAVPDGPGGPEAAARTARYRVLDTAAAALDGWLLLGHTLDDQAETVLLGLGRGSGPRSIAGMRPRAGRRVRPLLGVRRATTRAACDALGLPVWDDPHNAVPRFQRARLRHEVLPLLEDVLQGGVAEALARTATQLQDTLDLVAPHGHDRFEAHAADVAHDEDVADVALSVGELSALPRAVRTRTLLDWARNAGAVEVSARHVAALDALVADWHGQLGVDLPGGIRVSRRSGTLLAAPTPTRRQDG